MPEAVEVYNMKELIDKLVKGRELIDVTILSNKGKYRKVLKGITVFTKSLPMKSVGAFKKGKFIWLELYDVNGNTHFIWNTLGLQGFWTKDATKYSKVRFTFRDMTNISKRKRRYLYFNDIINYGTVSFSNSTEDTVAKICTIAPDIQDISRNEFIERGLYLSSRFPKKEIVDILIDQKTGTGVASGIGNYMRSEILYVSKINPFRKLKDIDRSDWGKLYSSSMKTITQVIARPYKYKVYKREFSPKGFPISKKKISMSRYIHWSPEEQL